jgi:T1SS-143 domain-containing protein
MTISTLSVVSTGVDVSLDETTGLQNATATPSPAEDANDNDTATPLPSAFSTRLTALGAGTAMDAALSGYTGAVGNTGSDAFTISGATSATDVSFVGSNGAPLNGFDSGLDTLDGTSILLYTDTVNNNILVGRAGAGGAIVFAAYIEETGSPVTGGKIWTVEYQPLSNPDATDPDDPVDLSGVVFIGASQNLEFSLQNAPSGQNLFLMFTTATPATETVNGVVRITDPAVIATGKLPANQSGLDPNSTADDINITTGDTINTSQAGGPTTFGTNNQMITEQEGIRFSFVSGARQNVTIPNLDQNEADLESNIDFTGVVNVKTVSFDVVQLQSGKSAVVKISAFSTAVESGTQFIDGYANDTKVDIVSVRVINISTGQVIENSNGPENDPAITISFAAGVATLTGIKAGYQIEYTTTLDHNRVLIENGAALDARGNTHADFDIDGLHLLQASITKAEVGSQMIFEDDGPAAAGTAVTGTVDEDGLTNGIAGGVGDVTGEATTASGSVTGIFQSGVDTPLTYALSSDTSGLLALSSGGVALVYSVVGNTLTAKAGTTDVFTFSLTAAGAYTFTLLKPLDHAAGNDENDITINLGSLLRATDKDGDTVTAAAEKLVITVDDDTPTATGTAVTGIVDEDGLANGIAGGVGDVAGVATTASGSVTGIFQSGADTPLTYALSSDTSGLPALSSGGVALVYSVLGNTLTATAGATDVFTFSLTAAGAYTFTLLKPLDHAAGNNENDITINLGSLLQATDKDGDTVTAAAEKLVITVDDDTPTATGTAVTGTVDEDGLTNGIPGGTGDVAGEATTATGSVTGIFQSGADTPLTYALSSVTSGLPALSSGGVALVYSVAGNTLTAKAGVAGADVFTFSLTAAGAYTFTLLKQLDHAAGNDENDITINLGTLLQATDKDSDTVTAAADKLVITVDDDTPIVTTKSNLIYANSSNGSLVTDHGGTGVFGYSIGADTHATPYSASNSDFLSVALTGVTVGTNAITNKSVSWVSETDSQATFNVGFTYVSNNPAQGATSNATGTLIFDKVADTYTLKLDQEIQSFSILNTSTPGNPLQGYAFNSDTTVGSNPPVSVMTLASNFFVQFEGFGVNNGTPQTFAYDSVTGLFSNDRRYVTVSSDSIGAASDTLQSDEVIDLDFYKANPKGHTDSALERATSKAIFLEFTQAGLGAGKDMLVVLKLVDDISGATINRTFIVGNSAGNDDVLNDSVPTYGFVAKAQNGIVVFESNDYNFTSSEHYSIQGAQVVTSTQNTSGSGYQLNGAIDNPATPGIEGATLSSSLTAFGGDTTEGNNEPIKIVNIGFVSTSTPDAHLTFDVALTDADADTTATQTLDVTIVGDNRVTASTGVNTFVIADTDVDGLLSTVLTVVDGGFATGTDKLDFTVAGSVTNFTEVPAPATNLAAFTAAADTALDGTTKYYFGVVGGDGYLAFDADGNGITTIIELVGVTHIASTDIV